MGHRRPVPVEYRPGASGGSAHQKGLRAGRLGYVIAASPFTARNSQIDWLQGYLTEPVDPAEAARATRRLARLKQPKAKS